MHISINTPHGLLMLLAFIFAICALIPWRAPAAAVPWLGLSWVFFLATFIVGA